MRHPIPGRFTAEARDVTVFLIGMRANRLHRPDLYVPVARAFMRMTDHLEGRPETGFLGHELWLGRTTISVQYWRSPEDLQAFAADANAPHVDPWRRFMKTAGSGDVGVWHETYTVPAGNHEAVYSDMPEFGLAKALGREKIGATTTTARQRLRRA
ncbi:DUF4188 domain-containing protein [Falsarthrobacter nasiphocae]|uniref:DUF4188 domain-containing protein n=1 Tax=Falsarthrobacter nasiphocae TaxID=189863 RepID=A0AAE4C680_9MICC|nr:DUF4188 domain-containing protein [Falsarthrobacter nasiphocae]MDR6892298.1 hypothetical protein [Falsarthrobacter nasiphocae]